MEGDKVVSVQVEIWITLTTIWEQSLTSIQACKQLRLIERFLDFLCSTSNDRVASKPAVQHC